MSIEWLILGILWFQHNRIVEATNEYIRTPSYFWSEEEIETQTTPRGDRAWKDFTDGPYLYGGLQYAGQHEFSWVVDIRSDLFGDQYWSIGMLINKNHVLTTCRYWEILEHKGRRTYEDLTVYYFSQYFEETPRRPTDSLGKELSSNDYIAGKSEIDSVTKDPKCTTFTIEFDLALVKLTKSINPYVPQLDFAPFKIDPETAHFKDYDLSKMYADKVICYVASVGRNYRNLEGPLTRNYKTKTRVYWRPWAECVKSWSYVCNRQEEPVCNVYHPTKVVDEMCFQSRNRVGSICDQDRGASLVCKGIIMGMVTRGATWKYCNNLIHIPFVAIKAKVAHDLVRGNIYHENQIWKSPTFNFTDLLPVNIQPSDPFPEEEIAYGEGTRTQITMYIYAMSVLFCFYRV